MSQTIQSKAVCVNCLEVFVWLIVVMSWGWQNRCSLPRYLSPPPLLSTFISHFLLLSFMYSFRLSLSLLQLSKLSLAICYFFLHHCVTIFLLLMCVLFAFFNSLSPLPRIVLYLLPSQQLYLSSSHPYLLAPLFFPLFPPKWIRIPLFNAVNHTSLYYVKRCQLHKSCIYKKNTVSIHLVTSKENATTTCGSLYRREDMH